MSIDQTFDPILFFEILTGPTSFNQFSKNLIKDGFGFEKQHSFEVGHNKALTRHQISEIISNQHHRFRQSASRQSATGRRMRNETTLGSWIVVGRNQRRRRRAKSFDPRDARERIIFFFPLHEIQPRLQRHLAGGGTAETFFPLSLSPVSASPLQSAANCFVRSHQLSQNRIRSERLIQTPKRIARRMTIGNDDIFCDNGGSRSRRRRCCRRVQRSHPLLKDFVPLKGFRSHLLVRLTVGKFSPSRCRRRRANVTAVNKMTVKLIHLYLTVVKNDRQISWISVEMKQTGRRKIAVVLLMNNCTSKYLP